MPRPKGSKNRIKTWDEKVRPWCKEDAEALDKFVIANGGKPLESSQSPKTAVYSLELKVNDKTYQSEGSTLEEALNNIKIEPTHGRLKIFTKGILKVKKGDKEFERMLMIRQMAGVFGPASKLGREVAMAKLTKLVEMLLV